MSAVTERPRGDALIFVVTIGLVITIAFALFMSSNVVAEDRAVGAKSAKSRVCWAEKGGFNYALSRLSFSRLCDSCIANNKDTDLAIVPQAYFNELNNNKNWTMQVSPPATVSRLPS